MTIFYFVANTEGNIWTGHEFMKKFYLPHAMGFLTREGAEKEADKLGSRFKIQTNVLMKAEHSVLYRKIYVFHGECLKGG
jgi:hypothetical protein